MAIRLSALIGLALCCSMVSADSIQIGEQPVVKEWVEPRYPTDELRSGREGWVVFSFMVDVNGTVYEPLVVGSYGARNFVRAARSALLKTQFEPAREDGVPVEASSYIRYNFVLGEASASRQFGREYQRFAKAFEAGDQAGMDKVLARLRGKKLNQYETAHLSYIESLYARHYGGLEDEAHYLGQALGLDYLIGDKPGYLAEDHALAARKRLFTLLIGSRRYAEALKLYDVMITVHGEQEVEPFQAAYEQLIELRENDIAYPATLQLSDEGIASITLHKHGFFIDEGDESVEEIKLCCARKYASFPHAPENQYQIPANWGQCLLQVRGTSDSEIRLIQF